MANKYLVKVAFFGSKITPEEQAWVDRLNEDTVAILKKNRYKLQDKTWMGYATDPDSKTISSPNYKNPINRYFDGIHNVFETERTSKMKQAFGRKHEAIETEWIKRNIKETGVTPKKVFQSDTLEGMDKLMHGITVNEVGDSTVGQHASLAVLGEEANDIKSNPNDKFKKFMIKLRNSTGEAQLLKRITGKVYGTDTFTKDDLEKLHTTKPDSIGMTMFGLKEIPAHLSQLTSKEKFKQGVEDLASTAVTGAVIGGIGFGAIQGLKAIGALK